MSPDQPDQPSENITFSCRSCGKSLEAVCCLRLWDGKDYCQACITNVSQSLSQRARDCSVLYFERPGFLLLLANWIVISGLLPLPFALLATGIVAISDDAPGTPTVAFALVWMVFFVVGLVIGLAVLLSWLCLGYRFGLNEGQFVADRRPGTRRIVLGTIASCQWYRGLGIRAAILPWYLTRPCLMMEHFVERSSFWRRDRLQIKSINYLCAFSKAEIALWEAFLHLSGRSVNGIHEIHPTPKPTSSHVRFLMSVPFRVSTRVGRSVNATCALALFVSGVGAFGIMGALAAALLIVLWLTPVLSTDIRNRLFVTSVAVAFNIGMYLERLDRILHKEPFFLALAFMFTILSVLPVISVVQKRDSNEG